MIPLRLVTLVLLATLVAVSSCGRKGDLVRPGQEPPEESEEERF